MTTWHHVGSHYGVVHASQIRMFVYRLFYHHDIWKRYIADNPNWWR